MQTSFNTSKGIYEVGYSFYDEKNIDGQLINTLPAEREFWSMSQSHEFDEDGALNISAFMFSREEGSAERGLDGEIEDHFLMRVKVPIEELGSYLQYLTTLQKMVADRMIRDGEFDLENSKEQLQTKGKIGKSKIGK